MIGKELYYIENNGICKDTIVSMYLQEDLLGNEEVMLSTKKGVVVPKSKASFSIQELFVNLYKEFEQRQKGVKNGSGVYTKK